MVWSWPCMVSILESRLPFMISMDWKRSAIIVSIPLRRVSKRSIRDIILARTSSFNMLDVPWNDGPTPEVPAPKEEVKGGGLSSSMLAPSAASAPASSVLTSGAPITRYASPTFSINFMWIMTSKSSRVPRPPPTLSCTDLGGCQTCKYLEMRVTKHPTIIALL
ncbi:hypothetical protein JCGZ_08620 [Jatropha curcas]|uniref:Uncharacterized protein n=1 Tax=Jatropha curcas TaxID=180498 RepID=A0A067KL50_JATCU|nr:hypothetical protein JCGZ_08620 [Jatropha curcas]